MPYRRSCAACALAAALLLSGCSAVTGSDVESLLRAPQASGETSAVQKALNSALGVTATLQSPASGDFLSPFLFGDWDGDGQDEAAVLYTLDASAGNVYLAVLEPTEENGWRVTQTAEGLSSEVESVNTAQLRRDDPEFLEDIFFFMVSAMGYTLMEILRTPERAAALREQLRQRIELLRLGCAKPAEPAAHSEEETP